MAAEKQGEYVKGQWIPNNFQTLVKLRELVGDYDKEIAKGKEASSKIKSIGQKKSALEKESEELFKKRDTTLTKQQKIAAEVIRQVKGLNF